MELINILLANSIVSTALLIVFLALMIKRSPNNKTASESDLQKIKEVVSN